MNFFDWPAVKPYLFETMKRDDAQRILYTRRFYHVTLSLEIDRDRCIRCDLCSLACPREALSLCADEQGLTLRLDHLRCVLCEVCAFVCPVSAITLRFDDRPKEILRQSGRLPLIPEKLHVQEQRCPHRCELLDGEHEHWCRQLRRIVENRETECPKYCFRCVQNCPRGVYRETPEGTLPNPTLCLRCAQCVETCPQGSIQVIPLFKGRVILDAERCPEDCNLCIDVCPVQVLQRREGRVVLNREICALCGACENICDREAIRVVREAVLVADEDTCPLWKRIRSALTSTIHQNYTDCELSPELRTSSDIRAGHTP